MAREQMPGELRAVLFVDVVESTRRLIDVGDAAWAVVLDDFEGLCQTSVADQHGRVVKTTGDGILAVLQTVTAAIDCAGVIHAAAPGLGLALRVGVHVGEVHGRGDDVAGAAVHLAARLLGVAGPGETIVSAAAAMLAPTASDRLVPTGTVDLKGFSQPVSVFVIPASGPQLVPAAPTDASVLLLLDASEYERAAARLHELDDTELPTVADRLVSAQSREEYLGVDIALVRLMEDVVARLPPDDDLRRSRLAAKLAFELRGDPTTLEDRQALVADARDRAERSGDPAALVDVLISEVHALWEPAGRLDRLAATEQAIAVARRSRLFERELDARIARVDVLFGLGRLDDAELELTTFGRLARPSAQDRQAFAASRRSSIHLVRGRFDDAHREAVAAGAHARAAGMPDAERFARALLWPITNARGDSAQIEAEVRPFVVGIARQVQRLPGHHMESTLALMLLRLGRHREARVELGRALASLRRRKGIRWLAAAYDAAEVAAALGTPDEQAWLLTVLEDDGSDFATLNFLFGGSTHKVMGDLATALGRTTEALTHYDRAVADLDEIGALPAAARARASRAAIRRSLGDEAGADADEAIALEVAATLGLMDLSPPTTDGPS